MKRIFLIDDDWDDRELITSALKETAELYSIHIATSGGEAMESLMTKKEFPDMILLDLNMPGMNGFDVLKELKKDPDLKPIPVIIFSTSHNKTDVDRSYSLGALKFITKPTLYSELVRVLRSLVKMI